MLWGACHFATGDDPVAQATHCLTAAQPDDTALLALDIENSPDGTTMTPAGAEAFLAEVTQCTGRPCVLYCGDYLKELLAAAPDPAFAAYPPWCAAYISAPDYPPVWSQWTLWQYTDGVTGPGPHAVRGIRQCDRSAFNGDGGCRRSGHRSRIGKVDGALGCYHAPTTREWRYHS